MTKDMPLNTVFNMKTYSYKDPLKETKQLIFS